MSPFPSWNGHSKWGAGEGNPHEGAERERERERGGGEGGEELGRKFGRVSTNFNLGFLYDGRALQLYQ